MKFAVAALLGVTSAALSEKQLIHNQLVALSGMVSEFDAPKTPKPQNPKTPLLRNKLYSFIIII
jgi:hypothetical protein